MVFYGGGRGDLNDIRSSEEKQGGRLRSVNNFRQFRNSIHEMGMAELQVQGRLWTWANNHDSEGFVEECLDRFCASPD